MSTRLNVTDTSELPTVAAIKAMDLTSVHAHWKAHDPLTWAAHPELYRTLGERSLKLGEPLLAYDILTEGLRQVPADVRLRQLLAVALTRSGAARYAEEILVGLRNEGHNDEETLGLSARIHKDRWLRATDAAEEQQQLRLAFEAYMQAYKESGGYWTAIN